MSDDRMLVNIEAPEQDAQAAALAHYQAFNAAVQQSQDYREKLARYQASMALVPSITEADDLLEVVTDAVTAASTTVSYWTNYLYYGETAASVSPTIAPEKPKVVMPVISQDAPNQAELSRLCRARDTAFFKYMRSLERDIPTETQVFEPDNRKLVATDELTKPYLQLSVDLRRKLSKVTEEIETTLKSQRTWMDFIIESVFPAFLLKLMDYMTFQDLTKEKAKKLRQAHAEIVQDHTNLAEAFEQQWSENYATKPPQDLKQANSTYLSKAISAINNDSLWSAYSQYNKTKTVSNLIDLYRFACQLEHQAGQNDEQYMKSQQLGIILLQLESLHPDMVARLESEKATTKREMQLLDAYRAVQTPKDETDKKAIFLQALADKYRTFLKTRNSDHFEALYQHIHAAHAQPRLRKDSLVRNTRALLKEQYSEAYQVVREHYIPHIDEQACERFLNKYEKLNYDHIIYTQIIAFMREPTWGALLALEQIMFLLHDADYDQDQGLASLVSDFMQICSTISVTSAADMRSERYSVGSFDDTNSTGSLTPSGSPSARSSRASSLDDTAPKLSEQALQRHNEHEVGYDPRMFGQSERSVQRTFNGNDYSPVP